MTDKKIEYYLERVQKLFPELENKTEDFLKDLLECKRIT